MKRRATACNNYPALLLLTGLLTACDGASYPSLADISKPPAVAPLNNVNARLAFTCTHETIPEASAASDVLFKYARWLQTNNLLKQDKAVDIHVERLYRIATESGHYKANINLQNGALRGHFHLTSHERLRFSQRLMDAKVASGYYFTAIYLENGMAGLNQDQEMALRYYRKAADEGSANAQAYIGKKLAPINLAPDIARQMRQCAAEQGDGEAANALGINLKGQKRYKEALETFQLGVAAGDETSAFALEHGFDGLEPTDRLYYLGQQKDEERVRRYKAIGKMLSGYSYAHPKVPEINEIVPLPPAELPAWDGKLKWVESRKANVPSPKPGEALIAQLAKAKMLNPATGKPLPSSPDFEKIAASTQLCRSGEPCPKSGYWQIAWIPHTGISQEAIRYFHQGDIMPTDNVERIIPRPWPLKNKRVTEEQRVDWRLVGEA
ncbi:sel1 repeat family protein [Cronobacter turicensis]